MSYAPKCRVCETRALVTGDDERSGTCAACRASPHGPSPHETGCAVCGGAARRAAEGARTVCEKCQAGYGLPAVLPASRRPRRPCGRCSSHVLVRSFLRERAARGGDYVTSYAAPLGVGFAEGVREKGFFTSRTVSTEAADLARPFGLLEAWTCRACGFTELYALDPEQIPIGPEFGTELVTIDEGYRS